QAVECEIPGGIVAVIRIQHQKLEAVAELETVAALHPGYVLIQAVDRVVFVPQLGAVPPVIVVILKSHWREAVVVVRIVCNRAAQLVSPVLAKRDRGTVMLGMGETV